MRFTSESSADGVTEQSFTVDEIPGVLWTPDTVAGPRPLILLGHGGGQHNRAPGITARAVRFAADGGFAAAAIDAPSHGDRPPSAEFTRVAGELRAAMAAGRGPSGLVAMHDLLADQAVADWQRVIGALQDLDRVDGGAIGYWGVSRGTGRALPLLAAEPRIRAAVLGLLGLPGLAEAAAKVTVPLQFLLQWDDELVPRDEGLALFGALASAEKTLHANLGGHRNIPAFEIDEARRFFRRHL